MFLCLEGEMHRARQQAVLTTVSLISIISAGLVFPGRVAAQDLVATEDLAGGSSVFVFKEGRKKAQTHRSTSSARNRASKARAVRISSQSQMAAKKRREAALAARTKLARSAGDRKSALSNTLTLKAEEFLDKNQIDLAVTNFRAALAQVPTNVRAREGLSNALTAKGLDLAGDTNNAAAIPVFEEAAKLDPQNDVAFARLGAIYDARDDGDNAIANYEKAVALNPAYIELYPALGIAYAERGDIAKAQDQLARADKAGVQNSDVDFLRGLLAFKNNRDDEALAAFEKASASDARFVDAQYYRGQVLSRQGKANEAVASYRGALKSDPTFAPAAFDLGVELYNSGNYDDAAVAYQEAVQSDPNDYQAHANLASTYRQLEQFPKANAEYKTASQGINTSGLYSEWGYCLGKTQEWDKAVARLNTASEMTPTAIDNSNVGWGYYNAGKLQVNAKNDAAAKTDFELARNFSQRAVALDPKLDAAYLNVGASQNALGEFQLAVQALQTALGLHGNWVIALNQLGYGYRGMGDLKSSIAFYKSAVGLDANNKFGLFNLTEAYYASGNKKEAKKTADQLRRLDPSFSGALDAVLSGKAVLNNTTRNIEQKIPKPRFPF
jgi:tetratricopeptide (TPR) repeat protein